ncbi:Alpha/Beta hydrolase protein [Mycena rosella]|uniref:Alpha/Beta hydrolase protein n=1 Tax=Mycena rosella TaxID=1033263 RepID=A0AAD7C6P7_MYCRO|nr:Alpha/Beta hydrolase protein [Mycena rosella]
MAEYSHLSEPDPEFAPYVAPLTAMRPILDLDGRRNLYNTVFLEAARKAFAPKLPQDTEYRVVDHQLEVTNGSITVRSLIPAADKTYPLMLWMHGGGWTCGHIEMDDYQLKALCVELQVSILNVDYRLAPEHPHPTPLDDCYSALKWAAESPNLFSADLKKGFIIGGLSAGAHLASVVAHRARDDSFFKDRQITGCILQVPPLVHPNAIPEKYILSLDCVNICSLWSRYRPFLLSHEQNKAAPLLTFESLMWSMTQLGGSPQDPEISPLLYSHKGLAPTVIQVCGMDTLRDDGLLYDKLLKDDGVKTKLVVYPGVPHAFHYTFPALKMAIKWEEDYRSGLQWLLDGAP